MEDIKYNDWVVNMTFVTRYAEVMKESCDNRSSQIKEQIPRNLRCGNFGKRPNK
jgi:hypothetical protein